MLTGSGAEMTQQRHQLLQQSAEIGRQRSSLRTFTSTALNGVQSFSNNFEKSKPNIVPTRCKY